MPKSRGKARPKKTRAPHSVVYASAIRDSSVAGTARKPARRGVMRRVTRSLTTVLTVAAVVFVATVFGRGIVAGQGAASPASLSTSDRARFVGTYELATTDVKEPATRQWPRPPNFNSKGYIIYADHRPLV